MNDKKTKSRKRAFIPHAIIIVGLLILIGMTVSRRKPPKSLPVFPRVLVQVTEATVESRQISIRGHGTVKPFQEISLSPQVSGRVEWVSPDFAAGGHFKKGEVLLRIEQTDYLLAVEQAHAAVAGADYAFAVAKANANIAQEEWQTMQLSGIAIDTNQIPDALVLHEPQLRRAEADFASAQAALKMAELQLNRTEITAPFNCRIKNESADPGQLINMGAPIATLYATDKVEIEVGLPMSELLWLEIPGATATVKLNLDGSVFVWDGVVARSLGVIDQTERLARVVVQVENPFVRQSKYSPELNIGTFVEVEIKGRQLEGIIPLLRRALREDSKVWIASEDSTLDIRSVTVERMTPTEVLISSGLSQGEKVILSSISGAAPGLKIRPVRTGATP